jgi:LysM repeat protein
MIDPIRNMRRLVIALIFSGALNVVALALLFYFSVKERPPTPYFESKPALEHEGQGPLVIDHSNNEVIRYFKKMPLDWLMARLGNREPVENGYTQRDLALASLVEFHHFDIERALSGRIPAEQKRVIEYGKYRDGTPAELTVFPGLTDGQYEAIVAFSKREKWPLTAKGLFTTLKKQEADTRDQTLVDSMMMTPEFLAVNMLFERSGVEIDKQDVLKMILEGDWILLSNFVTQQKVTQDLSTQKRQKLLSDYIEIESPTGALILIKSDANFAKLKLDDAEVMHILELLDTKDPAAQAYANDIFASPRSEAVRKKAEDIFKAIAKASPAPVAKTKSAAIVQVSQTPTVLPKTQAKPTAALTPAPKLTPAVAKPSKGTNDARPPGKLIAASGPAKTPIGTAPQESKGDTLYVVQAGDSLWKISKKFNVDIDTIKSYNRLETEFLSPGKTLKIPKK